MRMLSRASGAKEFSTPARDSISGGAFSSEATATIRRSSTAPSWAAIRMRMHCSSVWVC